MIFHERKMRLRDADGIKTQMKILIATNHSYMLWSFRKQLIMRLAQDFDIVLSMPFVGHEDDFKKMGVKCVETDIKRRNIDPIGELSLIRRYKKLLDTEKPDAVITYSIKPNIYLGDLCRKRGLRYFPNVQGLGSAFEKPILSRVAAYLYHRSMRGASKVFFENSEDAAFFIKKGIVTSDSVCVMPGAGIDLEEYTFCEMNEDTPRSFLYLGRIMKEKGVDEFFAAAELLKKELGDKVRFELVGFYEDAYREKVEKLVSDGVIVFYGFRTDPLPYYKNSHCVVVPSYHEGMSNVLLEAAAVGRVLITTNIPGCREALENGVGGLTCPPRDIDSLCIAMRNIALMPFDRLCEMGKSERLYIQEHFDRRDVVDRTVDILLSEIGG